MSAAVGEEGKRLRLRSGLRARGFVWNTTSMGLVGKSSGGRPQHDIDRPRRDIDSDFMLFSCLCLWSVKALNLDLTKNPEPRTLNHDSLDPSTPGPGP